MRLQNEALNGRAYSESRQYSSHEARLAGDRECRRIGRGNAYTTLSQMLALTTGLDVCLIILEHTLPVGIISRFTICWHSDGRWQVTTVWFGYQTKARVGLD